MTVIHGVKSFLRNGTFILFVLWLFISCVVSLLIYKRDIDNRYDQILAEQQQMIAQAEVLFSQEIGDMTHTIQLLHNAPSLVRALNREQAFNRELAEKLFASFVLGVRSLMQVRWIDHQGRERVRVNAMQGKAEIVPPERLQDKINRYYIQQAYKTPEDEVYLSKLDLNIEHGQLEVPYQPTIRMTLKTGYPLRDGLLVLNYHIRHLIRSVRALNSDLVQLQIIDQNGFWVMHPAPSLEWGGDLNEPQNNVQRIYPGFWQQLHKQAGYRGLEQDFGLVSYKSIDLIKALDSTEFNQNRVLYFCAVTAINIIDELKWSAGFPAFGIGLIIFLLGSWVLSREWKSREALIEMNDRLEEDKHLLKASAEYTQNLLEQQNTLQNDLVESRKLSALGMMVAGVAHELNTPLGTAIIAASTLRSELDQLSKSVQKGLTKSALHHYLESTQEGIDLIEASQHRAAELVRSFKRLAIDRAREETVSFNLGQVMNDLMKTLHHRLKSAHVETTLDIENVDMSGQPGVISQIMQNLIVNALHHAFEPEVGGKLMISGRLIQETDEVELLVSDNGKGIDPDVLPKLFDPFVTSKRSQGNTGLGMHFVYQWVSCSLQGTITVETERNKGTTFVINMPRLVQVNLPDD